ncbi:hypothetical protein N431DRAFT_439549 [Stipitochalara longipes BDJ]|nr:hypothetical protein N431DRAFT_439549 [Stipitochalara longipes BDJ]
MHFTLTTLSIFLGITAAMPGQTYYSTSEPPPVTYTAITSYSTGFESVPTPYPTYHTSMDGDCDECGGECGDGRHLSPFPLPSITQTKLTSIPQASSNTPKNNAISAQHATASRGPDAPPHARNADTAVTASSRASSARRVI